MRVLFSRSILWLGMLIVIILGVGGYGYYAGKVARGTTVDSTVVTRGSVSAIVAVSGKVEAIESAKLGFPVVGTVQYVYKDDGDAVIAGEVLASITQSTLIANYNSALQNVRFFESQKEELIGGPREEKKRISATNVAIARDNLKRLSDEYDRLVTTARETYLSSDLEARPTNYTNDDVPPAISGNYHCEDEGIYTITLFNSNAPSGYSYKLSGLETGTYTAFTDTPVALGSCGLLVQFDGDEQYRAQDWVITIPNTKGQNYLANKNAYILALQQQKNALEAGEQALTLALETERAENAPPTSHELKQADAYLEEARAQLALQEARIADYVIKAPFDGVITESDIKVGEIADVSRTMTIIKEGTYELSARIPEIDITRVRVGQHASVYFDAAPTMPITATLTYIAPSAKDINGVAYYKAIFFLPEQPSWLRAGLNADVHISIESKDGVLTIPKRFLIMDETGPSVRINQENALVKRPIQIGLTGTDGSVEVLDLPEGTMIVAP